EYLETIRQRYGCEFFVSEDLKTVIPVFWKDILKSTSKKDFSDKVKGEPVIEYVTPKSLKLCYKRSIDNAAMSVDTWEKFEREYGKITDYLEEIPDRRNNGLAGYADGYYFIQSDCSIYELYTTMGIYGKNVREWRFIMKAMFDYYEEGDDIEYKEITSNLEYVPFIMGYNRYTDGDSVYHSDFGPSLRFPYVGSKRHLNTSLKVIVTDEKGDKTETEKKEDPGSCPIMAVFYRYTELVNVYNLKTRLGMGTMHRYDADGKVAGNLDLTFGGEHGLYETFWKEYNEVLKNSFIKLTFDLVLSELDIAAFRMNELYYIDGQPLLPELLEYTIDKNGIEANKAEFRTVRLYKNLEEE
ncbi:MAG: hypothetical protein LBV71_13135, partial [Prevotella sp.]|nr:hypothetical protein [Prevotella sp.]